jgi:small subunit ribosomal protein S20
MANHKSAIKRIRSNDAKRLRNRYQAKTMRNAIKDLREDASKKSAGEKLPKVVAMVDKLAKKNVIHKNKAANLKSKLTKKVNALKK